MSERKENMKIKVLKICDVPDGFYCMDSDNCKCKHLSQADESDYARCHLYNTLIPVPKGVYVKFAQCVEACYEAAMSGSDE